MLKFDDCIVPIFYPPLPYVIYGQPSSLTTTPRPTGGRYQTVFSCQQFIASVLLTL
jgi:hypothetical protein